MPPPSKSDKRMLLISTSILLITCVLVGMAIVSRGNSPSLGNLGEVSVGNPDSQLPPAVVKQLTEIPDTPMLTGALADEIHAVEQMVADCGDYSAARRDQMTRHISWLLAPATLPRDMIIALGGNIRGRLISGMATFTLAEWGEHQKAPESCLLPIGKKLNEMLSANDEEPFSAFEGPIS